MKLISSPIVADDGNVAVKAADVVLQKYPSPATAVKPVVFTACQDVPQILQQKIIDQHLLCLILLPNQLLKIYLL